MTFSDSRTEENVETPTMILVFLTVFAGWIGFSLPYPVFSHLFLDTDSPLLSPLTSTETRTLLLGLAIAIYPVGQFFGAPLFGQWSDRFGRKRVLRFALATSVVGGLLLAAGVTLGLLPLVFLGRFIAGLGEGNIAIVQSLAADVSRPQTKARNFAAIGIAMDLGFVIGPILGGLLALPGLAERFGLALPFWAACALFALNALAIPLFLRTDERPRAVSTAPAEIPLLQAARGPIIAPLLILTFLSYWAVMIFFDFFPVFFVQLYETPPAQLGVNAALLSAPLILAGLAVGRVIARFGATSTAAVSLILMFCGIALFVGMTSEAAHILPAAIVAVGVSFAQTATSVLISDAAPQDRQGQVLGLYRATTVAAGALAALVGGSCAALAPEAPFMTAMLAAALGLILLAGLSRRLKCVHV